MLDRLEFLLGETFVSLRRNLLMSLAAITTVAASLFLLGGLVYVVLEANAYATRLTGRFEMRVHLKEGTKFPQISETAKQIRSIPGVREANWIPRDKAWARLQATEPDLTRGLENPLPDAFRIRINDLDKADDVVAAIRRLPTVEPGADAVQYLRDEQRFLQQAVGILRWVGLALGGLLLLTAGVLIYNAIRATIRMRQTELGIMRLVGATRATISTPLILEGVIQGAFGGGLASLLILACARVVAIRFPDLQVPDFPIAFWSAALAAVGALYGLVCSSIAVVDPLRQR